MSRFDLIFVLLDESERTKDLSLAKHIGNVHKTNSGARDSESKTVSQEVLKGYIASAKNHEPKISEELHNVIIDRYVAER